MSRLIQGSIRTKEAAAIRISTRDQLAQLVRADEELIGRIAHRPAEFYSEFQIPKANGELRTIRPPRRQLRTLQRWLLDTFYERVRIPSCLHGGVPNRSIFS